MKVSIRGFRCHREWDADIPSGKITILSGDSGSGKSSVLQAIYWCLYGKVRGIYNHNIEKSKKKCSVQLGFTNPPILIYRQGNPKLLKVITYISKNINTSSISNIQLSESFGPSQLSQDKVFEDAVAQAYIEKIFGTEDVWLATSFIQQGQRCHMLDGSNSDKMDLLDKISFSDDDPRIIIDKLHKEYSNQQALCEKSQQEYNVMVSSVQTELKLFESELSQIPNDKRDFNITTDIINKMKEQLALQKLEVANYEARLLEQKRLIGIQTTLSKSLIDNKNKLVNIPPLTQDSDITAINNRISTINDRIRSLEIFEMKYKGYYTDKMGISDIIKNICNSKDLEKYIPTAGPGGPPFSNNDIWSSKTHFENYNSSRLQMQNLKLEYTENARMSKINESREIISKFRSEMKQFDDYVQMKKFFADIGINSPDYKPTSLDEVNLLQKKYNDLQMRLNLMKCPHCNKSVRLINGNLCADGGEPVSMQQLNALRMEIDTAQRNYMKTDRYQHAVKMYPNHDEVSTKITQNEYLSMSSQIPRLDGLINILTNVRILSPPNIDYQLMIRVNEYFMNKQKVEQFRVFEKGILAHANSLFNSAVLGGEINESSDYNKVINELSSNKAKLNVELTELNNKYRIMITNNSLRKHIESEIENTLGQLSKITITSENVDDKYNKCRSDVNQITEKISSSEKCFKLVTWYGDIGKKNNNLIQYKQKIEQLYADMLELDKLHQTAIKVECYKLDQVVELINTTIKDMLGNIFEIPITVSLELYKELKTTKREKANVNLQVVYKGAKYDSIKGLSGGEADRVSLSLLLALNKVSPSPIILLDEAMSSLDGTARMACINAIRNCVDQNKIVIIINHEDVEGLYDNTIKM